MGGDCRNCLQTDAITCGPAAPTDDVCCSNEPRDLAAGEAGREHRLTQKRQIGNPAPGLGTTLEQEAEARVWGKDSDSPRGTWIRMEAHILTREARRLDPTADPAQLSGLRRGAPTRETWAF